ncbi:MAG: DUF882 domain-containing protein [Deltaproteobacteria bacterium]|nr:DUF882 domain-containing protein [Deltaproteobacteria bacterium]
MGIPASVLSSVSGLKRDGVLRLYHSHHDEWLEVIYEKNGVIDPEASRRINRFMRSRKSEVVAEMNSDLIRLLDHLQDHFGADTVEVICGYRSPGFNRYLKSEGKNVVENSLHLKGNAADIHLDEIDEKTLRAYLARLKLGGAGYYPDLMMVHADLGAKRLWQDGSFTNRLDIGLFTDLPVDVRTDKVFYFRKEKPRVTLDNPERISLQPEMTLEHFFRGKWREDEGMPFGKFRWKVEAVDGRYQYSNEFYIKRM